MKEYEIWMEGYQATGESSQAQFVGCSEGKNFKDACKRFYAQADKTDQYYYEPEDNTYWGCGLFQTHAQAAKSFG